MAKAKPSQGSKVRTRKGKAKRSEPEEETLRTPKIKRQKRKPAREKRQGPQTQGEAERPERTSQREGTGSQTVGPGTGKQIKVANHRPPTSTVNNLETGKEPQKGDSEGRKRQSEKLGAQYLARSSKTRYPQKGNLQGSAGTKPSKTKQSRGNRRKNHAGSKAETTKAETEARKQAI